MVKVSLKWFSLLLCAVVMMTSGTIEAQRKPRKKTQKEQMVEHPELKGVEEIEVEDITDEESSPAEASKDTAEAEPKKEEETEKEPEQESEAETKETAEDASAENEETGAEEPSMDEAEPAETEATEEEAASDESVAQEDAEEVQEEKMPAVIGSEDPAPEEEQVVEEETVVEEDAAEPEAVGEEAETTEQSPVEDEGEAAEGEEAPATEDEPVAEEPEPQPELGEDEIMGIDTVDLEDPQGNWLYKRVWWERAEAKYEKIRVAVTSVLEVRTKFFAQRAELDKKTLDPFYVKIGFSQGELKERLSERIKDLEKDIADKGEAELLERLEGNKQTLEELQKEVAAIVKQDEEVENAILMLVEQSNKMRNYEQQAWQDFKNIARVLDDKKARELFYKVDGAWRNIQELQKYVESNFSTGFDQLIERVKQQVQKVDAEMQALQEKGIALKRVDPEADEDEEEEAPQGIISRFIITPIKTVFTAIWDVIMWPIRKLMGTSKPEEEAVDEEPVAEDGDDKEVIKETITTVEESVPAGATQASPAKEVVKETIVEEKVEPSQPIPMGTPDKPEGAPGAAPPEVPEPQPEGSIQFSEEELVAKSKGVESVSASATSDREEPAPEAEQPAEEAQEVEEETIKVDEGEPMEEELDTTFEFDEE